MIGMIVLLVLKPKRQSDTPTALPSLDDHENEQHEQPPGERFSSFRRRAAMRSPNNNDLFDLGTRQVKNHHEKYYYEWRRDYDYDSLLSGS